jgi:hypothetical protein
LLVLLTGFVGVVASPRIGVCAEPGDDKALPDAAALSKAQPVTTPWYGYQLLVSDLASVGMIATGNQVGVGVGLVALALAPSVIHGIHKRPLQAVLSPVLRVGLTFVGAAAGASLESCSPNDMFCGLGGAALGGGLGLLTAMVLDWTVLSKDWGADAPDVASSSGGTPKLSSRLSAGAAPLKNGGATVVLGGRF